MMLADLEEKLAGHGLVLRGAFHANSEDKAPDGARTIVLVGNAGPSMWRVFETERRDEPHSLDAWTKRVVGTIAPECGGYGLYPSDGPPYFPFQKWAARAEPIYASPIGIAIHPIYGLWHAYRAAIVFNEKLDIPKRIDAPNPCDNCVDRPCLSTCPVNAFSGDGYDVPVCTAHLSTENGADCMGFGCRARRACPVGREYHYDPAQADFHMQAFLKPYLTK